MSCLLQQYQLILTQYICVSYFAPLVAKTVIEIPQVFKGKKLVVKLQEPVTTPDNEVPERKNVDETRTILVSDLPEGVSESDVHIHFQKKRNGGGEVEKVIISQEKNKALVVFEDPKGQQQLTETLLKHDFCSYIHDRNLKFPRILAHGYQIMHSNKYFMSYTT